MLTEFSEIEKNEINLQSNQKLFNMTKINLAFAHFVALFNEAKSESLVALQVCTQALAAGITWLATPTAGALEVAIAAIMPASAPYISAINALVKEMEVQILTLPASASGRLTLLHDLISDIHNVITNGSTGASAITKTASAITVQKIAAASLS